MRGSFAGVTSGVARRHNLTANFPILGSYSLSSPLLKGSPGVGLWECFVGVSVGTWLHNFTYRLTVVFICLLACLLVFVVVFL